MLASRKLDELVTAHYTQHMKSSVFTHCEIERFFCFSDLFSDRDIVVMLFMAWSSFYCELRNAEHEPLKPSLSTRIRIKAVKC